MCSVRVTRAAVGLALTASLLLAGGTWPAQGDEPSWEVKELWSRPLPSGLNPQDIIVSPDARHVAYRERSASGPRMVIDGEPQTAFKVVDAFRFNRAGTYVYIGASDAGVSVIAAGVPHGPYKALSVPTLSMSQRAAHVAYVAEAPEGAGQAVYLDGKPGQSEPAITALALADAAPALIYLVQEPGGQRVVRLNGARDEPFEQIDPKSLRIGHDGRMVAYTARRAGKWHIVINGVPGPPADRVGGPLLTLSPDGKRWACWTGTGPKPRYVADGVEHEPFQQVGNHLPLFSSDSEHLIYTAQDEKGWHVLRDGKVHSTWSGIAGDSIEASRDASQLLLAAQREGRWWVQVGETTHGPYDAVTDVLRELSADGKHFAFAARRGQGWNVLHDGHEHASANAIITGALSPDGSAVAYGAIVQGRPQLVIGDVALSDHFVLPGGLAFGDGGVLFAIVATNPESPTLLGLSLTRRR